MMQSWSLNLLESWQQQRSISTCVCVCVRACVRSCVRACARARVCVYALCLCMPEGRGETTVLIEVQNYLLTLWLHLLFFLPSNWHGDNFLHTFTWHDFFIIVTVWHGLFYTWVSWSLRFNSSRIKSTV